MEYQNTMLCSGYSHELKPCKHIMKCDLCIGPSVDAYGNEQYVCGPGVVEFKCKRDNPNWKPLTKQQFIELYNKMPIGERGGNIEELLKRAIIDGIVEDEKTYTTDVLPTTEPLKSIEVSVLYQGTKETKWIDCTYKTNILLSFPMQVHGYFSYKGDKINIKRVLKWKYR